MSAIVCDNVSIRYKTGDIKEIGLKEYFMRRLTGRYHVVEFFADKNITFTLEPGDMLGIIGANGAGKSTLLKALSGIMLPTGGHVEVNGNVAALLELGSGFDGDMTVKENTYFRGAMLGYTKAFLDEKYNEIIQFAELEDFETFAFKQLSSGMKSRLAFSIACMLQPDILILDEVLSVGDGAFRKKSGDKMRQILGSGITGLLVSHSIDQVRELCNKILWIDHGDQIAFTEEVDLYCDAYEQFLFSHELPKERADIVRLAGDFTERMEEERQQREKEEVERLQGILEQGDTETAISAAIRILTENCPEALSSSYEEAVRRVGNTESTESTEHTEAAV